MTNLSDLSPSDLRKICADRGLATSGSAETLRGRIVKDDNRLAEETRRAAFEGRQAALRAATVNPDAAAAKAADDLVARAGTAIHTLMWGVSNLSLDGDVGQIGELLRAIEGTCRLFERYASGEPLSPEQPAVTLKELTFDIESLKWQAEHVRRRLADRSARLAKLGEDVLREAKRGL